MKKSKLSYFDKVVLIEKDRNWVETKSSSYKRYKNTIEPLNNLLKEMEIL